MRVLVLETDRHAADHIVRNLQSAGHTVARCHEDDLPVFPCRALFDEGRCPLDEPGSVDVVVDHRAHAYPRPTDAEDGVACALRQHIPLVASGVTVLSPFEDWVTTFVDGDDDVVAACEAAMAARVARLERPANAAIDEIVEGASVEVHRRGGCLRAVATVPADAGEVEGAIAVKLAGVLRHNDRRASQIDVAVRREA